MRLDGPKLGVKIDECGEMWLNSLKQQDWIREWEY